MRVTHLAIVVALLFTSAVRAGEGPRWHLDLESAKQAARQVNRPILVHFWSPSCVPCVKLEQEVYSRPEVQRAMESMFVLARLNVDDYPATASNFGVKSWPADVILAPDGQFVTLLKCPLVASQYLAQLSQFGRTASPVAAGAPMRPELAQNGAASGPSSVPPVNAFGAAAANPVLQTSALASQPAAPMGAQSNSPYQWSNSADRIERYDFTAAQRTQGPSPPPQVGGQQPASPAGGEQSFSRNYQTAAAQTYDMVPALAAPSVGLDGYCPVQLQRVRQFNRDDPRYKFTKGDPRFGVVHRGRTYLFSGAAEQQEFLRDPDRYSPVLGGHDPVLYFDAGQQVEGDRAFGRFIGDRIYLFASQQSLERFLAENDASRNLARPNRYTEAIYQAENPSRGMYR